MKKVKEINPPSDYSIVYIYWVDSCEPSENSEVETCDIPSPQAIQSVGFLIKETKEYVSIAGACKKELMTFDYVISIPKKAIITIYYLHKNQV